MSETRVILYIDLFALKRRISIESTKSEKGSKYGHIIWASKGKISKYAACNDYPRREVTPALKPVLYTYITTCEEMRTLESSQDKL